jgi:hypothetical protein
LAQTAFVPQRTHDPPQSTSDSSESFVPFEQCAGASHLPDVHDPLVQSALPPHDCVGRHFAEQDPPQSTSISVPFFAPSEHVGTWHRSSLQKRPQPWLAHTPLVQSDPAEHFFWSAHLAQVPPPQSTSVSAPFIFASVHCEPHWPGVVKPQVRGGVQAVHGIF